jgi:transposase-like protein
LFFPEDAMPATRMNASRRRREPIPRAVALLAFRHLAEKGLGRLEIQERMAISRRTFYRLRAALAELGEHNQDMPDADEQGG